jgi:hypothetical protein
VSYHIIILIAALIGVKKSIYYIDPILIEISGRVLKYKLLI